MMKIFSLVLLSLIILAVLAWLIFPSGSAPPWSLSLLVIFCLYLLTFERVNAWWWARRFERRPDAHMEIDWEFSRQEVKTQSALWEATIQWKVFLKVVDAGGGFLFYTMDKFFYWVPFSAFESPDCVELVRRFVKENDIPLIQVKTKKR